MLKRLITIWIDYRVHHISEIVTRCLLGVLVVSVPVASVSTISYTSHHKTKSHHHKLAASSSTKPIAQSPPVKKVVAAKPPAAATPTQPTTSAPQVVAPKPTPVPASQPSPGSGAKKLTPAPAVTITPPTDTSTPSDPTSASTPAATDPTTTPTPTYATGGFTSTNWAGYVATAGNYQHISSSWIVPTATGNGTTTTGDSTWIGIGGVFSSDLIQTGTINTVSAGGQVNTFAFYELLPDSALEIPSLAVGAGDSMTAAIDEISTGIWTINISDATSGQSYTTSVNYTSSNSTAEWIEEDPSFASGGLVPFDHFTPASFNNAKVDVNGVQSSLSSADASPITLVDQDGTPLAKPTVLNPDGLSFSVYRQ